MSDRSERVDVRGVSITLRRAGAGEPLLYLHSATNEVALWGPGLSGLAARAALIAPVHPGFPGSDGVERIDHISDLVLHYVDLLDALGIARAHVVGSSLGGWIAAELASLYPERVGSLVLCGAAGLWIEGAPIAEAFNVLPDQLAERLYFDQQHPMARMLHAAAEMPVDAPLPEEMLLAFHQSNEATARVAWNPYFHNPKLEGRLDRISAPTLVLWGGEDRFIPPAHGERYAARIRGATLQLIPACGHLPVIERPDAFVTAVQAFLARHSPL